MIVAPREVSLKKLVPKAVFSSHEDTAGVLIACPVRVARVADLCRFRSSGNAWCIEVAYVSNGVIRPIVTFRAGPDRLEQCAGSVEGDFNASQSGTSCPLFLFPEAGSRDRRRQLEG